MWTIVCSNKSSSAQFQEAFFTFLFLCTWSLGQIPGLRIVHIICHNVQPPDTNTGSPQPQKPPVVDQRQINIDRPRHLLDFFQTMRRRKGAREPSLKCSVNGALVSNRTWVKVMCVTYTPLSTYCFVKNFVLRSCVLIPTWMTLHCSYIEPSYVSAWRQRELTVNVWRAEAEKEGWNIPTFLSDDSWYTI